MFALPIHLKATKKIFKDFELFIFTIFLLFYSYSFNESFYVYLFSVMKRNDKFEHTLVSCDG